MGLSTATQLHSVNLAMRYFEQLEVIPINLTCIMICWMVSGMLVLREGQYYTVKELVVMFTGFVICCTGIRVLMAKIKSRRGRNWRLRAASFELSPADEAADDDGYSRQESGSKLESSRARASTQ